MNTKNDIIRELLNVNLWHSLGYNGSSVTIANGESWSLHKYNKDNLCLTPIKEGSDNEHGEQVSRVIHEFAPECKIIYAPFNSTAYEDECIDYFIENDIPIATLSISSSVCSQGWKDTLNMLKDTTSVFVCSGNDGSESYNGKMKEDLSFGIGAVRYINNEIQARSYSSESEYVDYAGFTDIYTDLGKFTGTSCATPQIVSSIGALVQDFFKKKTKKFITPTKLREFFTDYAIDVYLEGKDEKTGYGIVVLPHPDDIDILKYQPEYEEDNMDIKEFKDYSDIADWTKEDVQYCVDNNIVKGNDTGEFNPKGLVTREELCVFLARVMRGE